MSVKNTKNSAECGRARQQTEDRLHSDSVVGGVASIELTRRCNLACPHCALVRFHPAAAGDSAELSRRQVIRLADGLAAAGIAVVRLYGGEVYLRRDLQDILRYLDSRGMRAVLDTNGTLLTSRRAAFLASISPQLIEIPLFGATRETYESTTGVPGAFARFQRGVELLRRRHLPLRLRGIVLAGREDTGPALQALASQMGVPLDLEPVALPRNGERCDQVERADRAGLVRPVRAAGQVSVGAG